MIYRSTARRLPILTITLVLAFSGFTFSSSAKGRNLSLHSTHQAQNLTAANLRRSLKRSRPQRTFDVLNYTIRTRFDVPNKTVIGDEIITLKPLSAGFKSFELDASNMKIEAVTLSQSNLTLQWSQPPDKLSINMDRAYHPDETIAVRIQYRAKPERGLYFVPQTHSTNAMWSKPAQIWTQGEPEENHYWFPCYDYPDDKATSEQFITTKMDEIAISNGSLIETINNPDNTRTFHWKIEQPHACETDGHL
jgi:aminopeptidase N